MQFLNTPLRSYYASRKKRIEKLRHTPIQNQAEWFRYLVKNGEDTIFFKQIGLTKRCSYADFVKAIPIQNYNSLQPFVERIMKGEEHVLWNSRIKYMAKSSGTTDTKSKFIPVSKESLFCNNYLSAQDSITFYCHFFPQNRFFSGKGLVLGGSFQETPLNTPVKIGDVSAVLLDSMPQFGDFLKASNRKVLLHNNWNEKLSMLAKTTLHQNITSLSGVPSWMLLVLKEVLKLSGKEHIKEVWPNLELFFHGGVAFAPYIEAYKKLIPDPDFFYMNMYNASEGFFGFQDQLHCNDLLLLTDNGIFYEFIPIDEVGTLQGEAIPLQEVSVGQDYALVITTPAGLWRYVIGDTIRFTSTDPYRFKITGRTMHYINAFGEELIIDNTDKALQKACEETGAIFVDYTAAPIFLEHGNMKASHEWVIEFSTLPKDIDRFIQILDQTLQSLNSDYEAKRTNELLLNIPIVHVASEGTFLRWLEKHNRLGGQYKVPRLQNDRSIMEEFLELIETTQF